MKKLLFIPLLFISVSLSAFPIGEKKAREIATQFFAQTVTRGAAVNLELEWAGVDINAAMTRGAVGDVDEALMYIYNRADSKGFVTLHLNGEELRAHARNRSTGGRVDFNRTRRQREILEAAFEKSKTMSITELMSFLGDALPLVTTDISYSDFVGYISNAGEYTSYEFESFRIPSDGCWKYWKNYVLITNTEKTMKQWFNMVYN